MMDKKNKKTEILTFRLTINERINLKFKADNDNLTVGELIRRNLNAIIKTKNNSHGK